MITKREQAKKWLKGNTIKKVNEMLHEGYGSGMSYRDLVAIKKELVLAGAIIAGNMVNGKKVKVRTILPINKKNPFNENFINFHEVLDIIYKWKRFMSGQDFEKLKIFILKFKF